MIKENLKRILVVDDDRTVANSLKQYLEDADFEVTPAGRAEEALSFAEDNVFDAAILDIRLPGMNGEELLKRLHERDPSMRFLIYTGSSNYTLPESLVSIGIREEQVIPKPAESLSVFLKKINDLFNKGNDDG